MTPSVGRACNSVQIGEHTVGACAMALLSFGSTLARALTTFVQNWRGAPSSRRLARRPLQRAAQVCFGLLLFAISGVAHAQSIPPPPSRSVIDANGVNLVTGAFHVSTPRISIGQSGTGGLAYARTYDSNVQGWRDNVSGAINSDGTIYTVTLFGASETFTAAGGTFTPAQGQGSTLVFSSGSNTYTYTAAGGAVAVFSKALAGSQPTQANEGRITSFTQPSGETTTFTYIVLNATAQRLQSINNNLGYQLKFEYQNNDPATGGLTLVKVTAINNAVDYCNPTADSCSGFTFTWPSLSFDASQPTTVTDALGRVARYTYTSGRLTGVRRPSSATDNITVVYGVDGLVDTVSDGATTLHYVFSGGTGSVYYGGPPWSLLHHVAVYNGRVTAIDDQQFHTLAFQYDSVGRVTHITEEEGNYTQYTYDARGNITQTRRVAKAGSGLADIITIASFPANCTDLGITPATCNQPISTTDERGFRTDYTYDPVHGGLLSATASAPSGLAPIGSGTRPETRLTYTSLYAWYKNSSGVLVQAPTAVVRSTTISACATLASCAGDADETKTSIAYGSPGIANNLLPTSRSAGSGDGALTATSTMDYDAAGNVKNVDGPLPGTADTTRLRYDAARQPIGIVGPDPDGGGSLKHQAARIAYNLDGQIFTVERGTVNSQSDPDWAAFASQQMRETTYNAQGRRAKDRLVSSTPVAIMQYAYDALGRLDCVATRMNPTVYASLPASACTLSTEDPAYGPDRITKYNYLGGMELASVQTGYATANVRTDATYAYTPNRRLDWIEDANGNRSDYLYDGFDRLIRLNFPQTTIGAHAASATDYEAYGYHPTGNIAALQLRSGETVQFEYDNLNRPIRKDLPGGTTLDVYFAFDLLGRPLSARHGSTSGDGSIFTYDALGRVLSETSYGRTVSFQYDLAGNRRRLTYPDGNYIEYTRDLAGRVDQVLENGSILLVDHAYNNLGDLTSIARGNGASTTFGYDTAERLTSFSHDFAGTSEDVTFNIGYNPASQVLTRTHTNSAYTFTPSFTGHSYAPDGLNRYANVDSTSYSYDGRGNLTSDGSRSFAYDFENRLTQVSGGASLSLAYDPRGRLYRTIGSTETRFLYDGDQIIAEYDGAGNLLRRYVPGARIDEPLAWYEGAGLAAKRWFHTDQQGSIIARSDINGVAAVWAYSAYGEPGGDNWLGSRFLYTGQAALPDVRLYHYRARAYDPALGRFLQTDPIQFGGGMNIYAYVNNDPANFVDPSGLEDLHIDEWQFSLPGIDVGWGLNTNTWVEEEIVVTGQRVREPSCPSSCRDAQMNLRDLQRESGFREAGTRREGVEAEIFTAEDIENLYKNMDECSTLQGQLNGFEAQLGQLDDVLGQLTALGFGIGAGVYGNSRPGRPFENRPGAAWVVGLVYGAAIGDFAVEVNAARDAVNRRIGATEQQMSDLGCR